MFQRAGRPATSAAVLQLIRYRLEVMHSNQYAPLDRFSTTRGFFPNRLGNDAGGSLGMFYKQKMKLAIFVMKASNIFIVTRFSKKLCNMNGTINSPLKVVISFYR